MENVIVVDANARGEGRRVSTLDVIGVGPRLITSIIKTFGLKATLYPYEAIFNNEEILKEFDAIAISFMISDYKAVKRLVSKWKRINGGIVVLGGPGTLSQSILRLLDFSIAFKGEAEVTLQKLLSKFKTFTEAYYELSKSKNILKGLAIKNGENILDGGIGEWTPKQMLNIIPEINDLKNYPFFWASRVYVETVRGCSNFRRAIQTFDGKYCNNCHICYKGSLSLRINCPMNIPPGCGYCSVPMIHGPARSRNLYSIVEEIEKLINIGVSRIVLSAPDFLDFGRDDLVEGPLTDPCKPSPNIKALEDLLSKISKIKAIAEEKAVVLIENIKPCLVNNDVAEVLGRYVKDTAIYIGLESCSDDLLEKVGRPSKCFESINAIKLLKEHRLRPYVYLMHGLPFEKDEDILKTIQTIDLLRDLGVERIVLYRFTPLPYTAFEFAPRPKAAIFDPLRKILYDKVKEFNINQKKNFIGKLMKAIIAHKYGKKKGYLIAYPMKHGPVVIVKGSSSLIGHRVTIRITNVISDRVVFGEIIYVHEKHI
ncbi:radical SAM protein [Ignisphaera sp. 4213-co]|uniref:Radical SAM protein n=1 Tax=Ignisphaera cupida TaxID=3050454 RepID=A0ABD4Z349_9CREN|nr:radical SAM protein [Ignisphaera sp. 4213-co]MDK6027772.1 radical SAM protein [Ignisphaera sp. 4213-co]